MRDLYTGLPAPLLVCLAMLMAATEGAAADILPIIDAHSQFDADVPVAKVIHYAAKAGVTQVLLSARRGVTTAQVVELHSKYPGCIVPSVRTKGGVFDDNQPEYYTRLDEQFSDPAFGAMSEIILAHAAKGKRAREVYIPANSPQVQEAIQRAAAHGWPVVLHYEFRWLTGLYGSNGRAARIAELNSLINEHPQQVFALIHLAQLDPRDIRGLIMVHPNLVFLPSHANPVIVSGSRQPWSDMFAGRALAPEWKELVLAYPDRFVLAFDNVWPEHWSDTYVEQVGLWRAALGQLPAEVAHAVAHGNAERLWKLAPAAANQGCAAIEPPPLR